MSYDDDRLIRLLQAAEALLRDELGLEFATELGLTPQLSLDHRSDEQLAGGKRQHILHLPIAWDGTLPVSMVDPNAEAGDDFQLSEEERALFESLDPSNVKEEDPEDDDRLWSAEQAVRQAERSSIVEDFFKLRSQLDEGDEL